MIGLWKLSQGPLLYLFSIFDTNQHAAFYMHDKKNTKKTRQNSLKKKAVMAQDESWAWESTVITEAN